ncbi:CPBP family intramembrane glutamic endopeptidase [Mycobacterium sp. 1274756.6]|uniref:CPBP family intramembrane glutamic endopeptidase n=1 Tax=Mycobacterium sp. 1274756.6 TaxID=1834076 RepID=UPI0008018308|nr:CPBP family intramembrane glutamic endopeptidase [Mycobacterium sp. 1274756.6]OBJ67858.1 abortive infection protein [Mycobacterium sp. 1274756.6]
MSQPGLIREFGAIITTKAVPHNEPPAWRLRRRIVVAVVLVGGTVLLRCALGRDPGEPAFFWMMLGLAALWAAGALVSGPLHLGVVRFRGRYERPVFTGTGIGLVLGGLFVLAAWVARQLPALAEPTARLMEYVNHGNPRLMLALVVLSAIAEEMFFRGAVYTALGRYAPVLVSTLLFAAVSLVAGSWLLALVAVVLGLVCGVERRATNGVLAPVLTHLVWGFIVALAIPPLFA